MKLNDKQKLYVRSMGKDLKVTGIFTDDDNANDFCRKNRDHGIVADFGEYIFTAFLYDHGVSSRDGHLVRWEMDVEGATTPEAAAEQAFEYMQRDTTATVFSGFGERGGCTRVDLLETGENDNAQK